MLRLQYEVGGSPNQVILDEIHTKYHRIHSQDSPSDIHGKQPSDNSRQMVCCGLQAVILQSTVQSAPILSETQGHLPYLPGIVHEPVNTSNWLWLDQGIERIHYLTVPHNDNSYRANRRTLIVSRFKVYSCKIFHCMSFLYLFHILLILPAMSFRSQTGSSTSTSSPFDNSSIIKSNSGRRRYEKMLYSSVLSTSSWVE